MKKGGMEKAKTFLLLLLIFLFFVVFFFKLHPIMIFDTDDWYYAQRQREALPQWGAWNPAKILPEILTPFVTLFGAFGIDPFVKDHFVSISLSYALTVALVITVLCGMLYRLLKEETAGAGLLLYFLLCHFWIYRTAPTGNAHMLSSVDATCYFNYVIPNLLNCILVLWLMQLQASRGSIQKGFSASSSLQKGIFVLLCYLAVFSNIWSSIILAVYAGASSLFDGIRTLCEKRFSLAGYLREHLWEAGILLLWAVQQLFELNGGRAQAAHGSPFFPSLLNALYICLTVVRSFNPAFWASAAAILLLGLALAVVYKEKETLYRLALLFTALLVSGLYLALSCARAGTGYLSRPDVQYGCFFFGMLMLLVCAGTLLRRLPPARALVPLLLVMILCNCNTGERTYAEALVGGYPPDACMRMCNDIMQQFLEAQELGQEQLILEVPQFNAAAQDNWPIGIYAGPRFSAYFYKMGITERRISVTEILPTPEKNAELGL